MSNQKNLNVRGTERMCLDHIRNVNDENMRDLENTYQLNCLELSSSTSFKLTS